MTDQFQSRPLLFVVIMMAAIAGIVFTCYTFASQVRVSDPDFPSMFTSSLVIVVCSRIVLSRAVRHLIARQFRCGEAVPSVFHRLFHGLVGIPFFCLAIKLVLRWEEDWSLAFPDTYFGGERTILLLTLLLIEIASYLLVDLTIPNIREKLRRAPDWMRFN